MIALARKFLASRVLFHAIVAVLLLVPQVFGSRLSAPPWHFGLPRIHSGDEPHYLVFINSLIKDHDLDLSNNYEAVHQGTADDAGLIFRGAPLDHHTIWFVGDRRVHWYEVYEGDPFKWKLAKGNHRLQTLRNDVDPAILPQGPHKELPWNVPGLAILIAPFVAPFARTPWVEPAVAILAGIVTVLATLFWRRLARVITEDQMVINLGLAATFLGTPVWYYGRTLFSEAYLVFTLLGAFAFAIGKPRWIVSGFFMGMAIFIKPFIVVVGLPIGLMLLWKRQFKAALLFGGTVTLWVGAVLLSYHLIYGSAFRSPNEWVGGPVFLNALHIIAYPTRGLISTAPIALVAIFGWPDLLKQSRELALALAATLILFVFVASNRAWAGGFAYSVRYVIPVVPLFCLGLLRVLDTHLNSKMAKSMFAATAMLSILVNGLAAAQYWRGFNGHPFIYLLRNTDF